MREEAIVAEETTQSTMPERDDYPPGVPCWVDTAQPDPEAAARFYAGVFGWEVEDAMPPDVEGHYFMGRIRGRDVAGIGSQQPGMPPTPVWATYIAVTSADDAAAAATAAGGSVLQEPFDVFDSGRMAVLGDREGAVICVWQAGRHRGSQLVNEPGSVVFNTLNTRDPEAARVFYGAVFGWRIDLDADFTLWSLPGYGDYLEEHNPGLRERLAAGGAPSGFEDVVAALARLGEDSPHEVPPHWSVTFSTADADASAGRVAELGGTVLVPPFDMPPVRLAVLQDPQGASFAVSRYMPEISATAG